MVNPTERVALWTAYPGGTTSTAPGQSAAEQVGVSRLKWSATNERAARNQLLTTGGRLGTAVAPRGRRLDRHGPLWLVSRDTWACTPNPSKSEQLACETGNTRVGPRTHSAIDTRTPRPSSRPPAACRPRWLRVRASVAETSDITEEGAGAGESLSPTGPSPTWASPQLPTPYGRVRSPGTRAQQCGRLRSARGRARR
jgi:hypothetical protein